MKLALSALLGLVALANATVVVPRDFDSNDYYVLHLDRDTSPDAVAESLSLRHEGPLGELQDHHLFVARKSQHDVVKRSLSRRGTRSPDGRHPLDGVLFSQKQILRKPWEKRSIPPGPAGPQLEIETRAVADPVAYNQQTFVLTKLGINDPIFRDQWHLYNTVQPGHDVNVTGLWLEGITGKNATVSIVDDGLDMSSDDLKGNYYAAGSYDFNDKSEEPKPRLSDDHHGTRCAGEVAAVINNVCGVGVAYDAQVSGLRILSKLISDADEAVALNYDMKHNHIYSCSWGPPDDGRAMDAPGILIRRAMLNAIQYGRDGLGSIYVFASGNGAANDDNCNFDGYTNSIYSITVGAIDRKGLHPYYSEKCSAGLVVTYSSGSGDAIHTTDVGQNNCYNGHGGTSAAAPLAAGIFALVLQVRPDLTWRDMQYLVMMTALPLHLDETGEWQDTTIGKKFSHTYGYGKIDSYGMVQAAKTWVKVKPQAWLYSPWITVNQPIPQGDAGISVSFEVTPEMVAAANFERIEHVTVTMNVKHTRRGDLGVDLVSPNKIVSHLSVPRRLDNHAGGYEDWTFMSVVHWGESGVGTWTIIVRDTLVNEFSGTFTDWHLKLWGECKDPAKATLLPMPTDDDDKGHTGTETTTLPASTPTPPAAPITPPKPITTNPADHPDRPVNGKPPANGSDYPSTWLSFLPSFGMSARTQAWFYGSLALIGFFCIGLGIYMYIAHRRRKLMENREEYQFELLDEDVAMLAGREKGAGGGRGKQARRTRGGELYDAFAGGSDDETEEDFADAAGYRDRVDENGNGDGSGKERMRGAAPDADQAVEEQEEELHHVVGDDEDEGEDVRPLAGTRRLSPM